VLASSQKDSMPDELTGELCRLIELVSPQLSFFIVEPTDSQDALEYEIERNVSVNGALLDFLAGQIDCETYLDIVEHWHKQDIDSYVDAVEEMPPILITDVFGNVVGTA